MKKVFALLLCVTLLIALPTGCKKNDGVELTEATVTADLIQNSNLYFYPHCGKADTITNLKIAEKTEKDNTASLVITATAVSPYTEFALTANMDYTYENGHWNADHIEITKVVPTTIAGPDPDTAQMEIANYVSIVGSALAVKGEKEHALPAFNPAAATWEMQCEKGAKTAQLHINYKSEKLAFKGYYTLTFSETGWSFETKAKDDKYHILLHLESLEQK